MAEQQVGRPDRDQAEPHEWGTAPDFVGPRHRLREQVLLAQLIAADPGSEILNAGAGQGTLTLLLERRGFRVTSSDVTTATLDHLRRRVAGDVVYADMTRLPFADGRFDAVVAGEVLEHIENDALALREVRRVLAPGGVVAVSVPAHPDWFGPSDEWAGHVRRYTKGSLLEAFAAADLAVERWAPWGFPVSAFWHRKLYDSRAPTEAGQPLSLLKRGAVAVLGVVLQVDRLFVGVERGCLGYIAVARKRDAVGTP